MREWGGSDEMEDIVEAGRQRREREECNSEAASTLLMLGYSYDGRKWNPPHADGVAVPVRFFRWEVAQAYTGTIYRVKDERGDWVADFAEKDQAERFCHTHGVGGRDAQS